MKSWRKTALERGMRYVSIVDVPTFDDVIREGRVVLFDGMRYSLYDAATVLRFFDEENKPHDVWVHDDESIEFVEQCFARLD